MDWKNKKYWRPPIPVLGRRSFLKIGAAVSASLMFSCSSRERLTRSANSRSMLLKGDREWSSSVCTLCPSGCAIRAYSESGRIVAVGGDPEDPNTGGKMCPIGLSILNLHTNPDRLTRPFRRNSSGKLVPAAPEEVVSSIASRIRSGDSLHVYGLITPFTSHVSKGLNAACHLDPQFEASSFSSLLNTDGRPPLLDFENARIALLFNSNILEHGYPFVGYVRRIAEARLRGLRLVTLSPFLTNTATAGDWIPVRSGSAAQAAAVAIAQQALKEPGLPISQLPGEIRNSLLSLDPAFLEQEAGLPADQIRELTLRFFREPGPAWSDTPEASVLLLNILKGNLNRPGGLLHPGQRHVRVDADSGSLAPILGDRRNIVLLHRSNPAFSMSSEILPILHSAERATVICVDSFPSETAELSDFVLPLASPLETLTLMEPPALASPYLSTAAPVAKPQGSSRSFDDWLTLVQRAVQGSAPPLTPEDFATKIIRSVSSTPPAPNRAIYPIASAPGILEPNMASMVESLNRQIAGLSQDPVLQPDQCCLAAFEESIQGPGSAPSKWLDEIGYSPKIYLHPERAGRLGIRSGDPVTLTGSNGVSRDGIALPFEGIHPDSICIPLHYGHTGYGRVARGERFEDSKDPDMSRIYWGKNRGINRADFAGDVIKIQRKRG